MPSARRGVLVALLVLLAGCGGTGPTGPTTVVTDSTAAPTTTPGMTTPSAEPAPTTTPLALGDDAVAATDATLCAGDTVTIRAVVRNVAQLQFEGWVLREDISTDWENATLSPNPYIVMQSLPPSYVWDAVQPRVEFSIPVTTSENVTPGTYDTRIKLRHTTERTNEDPSTTIVTITVRNETACA